MRSLITDGPTKPLFRANLLRKHDVQYFQCCETGFIQTESPYWLEEAYSDAITALDIGLLGRNLNTRRLSDAIIRRCFDANGRYVDFGGGYGIFVRLMRDWGYDFWLSEPFCENLFAKQFSISSIGPAALSSGIEAEKSHNGKFELLTAWELFEHLVDPKQTLEEMFELSDSILFSTFLVPQPAPASIDDWWYFIPETGQHVSLYTRAALESLASRFGARLMTDGQTYHLMTRRTDVTDPFGSRWRSVLDQVAAAVARKLTKDRSLLQKDMNMIRDRLNVQP